MNRLFQFLIVIVLFAANLGFASETNEAAKLQWFRDAKFGLFVHWGLYSVAASQWGPKYDAWVQLHTQMPNSRYEQYAKEFNPTNFNAQQWASIAKDAGMKYMVITAKHHEGFCMWDTKLTDYNIVKATPWHHDPIKDLAEACNQDGLKLGFLYSLPDWHHPDMPAKNNQRGFHGDPNPKANITNYLEYTRGQVAELLTNYHAAILWFDGGGIVQGDDRSSLFESDKMVKLIHELQPDCLINNRLGAGKDFAVVERNIPPKAHSQTFEVCMPLNDLWGYNSADQNWKSPQTVIQDLATISSMGGNFLLDIGAAPDGTIPKPAVNILKQVGDWLKVNGESIYGTGPNPWQVNDAWGCITAKGNSLFLHVFVAQISSDTIRLKGLKSDPANVVFLEKSKSAGQITVKRDGDDLLVKLPAQFPNLASGDDVVELDFADKPEIKF